MGWKDILKQRGRRKCGYCRQYRCRCDHDSSSDTKLAALDDDSKLVDELGPDTPINPKISEETFNQDKDDAESDIENLGPLAVGAGAAAAGFALGKD